ncbi:MAG: hypothetical protein ACQERZ_02555 [Fusobacteriota bacterium]
MRKRNFMLGVLLSSLLLIGGCTTSETEESKAMESKAVKEEKVESQLSETLKKDYKLNRKILATLTGEEVKSKDVSTMSEEELYDTLKATNNQIRQELYKQGFEKPINKINEDYENALEMLSIIEEKEIKKKDLTKMTPAAAYEEFQNVMEKIMGHLSRALNTRVQETEGLSLKLDIIKDYEDGIKLLSLLTGEKKEAKKLDEMTTEKAYKEFQNVISQLIEALGKAGAEQELKIQRSKEEIINDYKDGINLLSSIKGEKVEEKDLSEMSLEESYREFQNIISMLVQELGLAGAEREIAIEKSKEEIIRDYKDASNVLSAIKNEKVKVKDLSEMSLEESYKEFQKVISEVIKAIGSEGAKQEVEIERSKDEIVKDYEDGINLLSAIKGEKVEGKDLSEMSLEESYKEFQSLMSQLIKQLAKIAVERR